LRRMSGGASGHARPRSGQLCAPTARAWTRRPPPGQTARRSRDQRAPRRRHGPRPPGQLARPDARHRAGRRRVRGRSARRVRGRAHPELVTSGLLVQVVTVTVMVVPGRVIVWVSVCVCVTTFVTVTGGDVLVTVRPGVVCEIVRVCVRISSTVDAGRVITLPLLVIVRAGIFFLTIDTSGAPCTLTTVPFSVIV